jgi:hypothetical protein
MYGHGSTKKKTTLEQVSVQMSTVVTRGKSAATGSSAAGGQQGVGAAAAASIGMLSPDSSCCPTLTLTERVYGCVGCFILGIGIGFAGWVQWTFENVAAFAVLYTIGNIVAICGSFFLMGPARQCRRMKAARRRVATSIYLAAMILTVVVALTCRGGGCNLLILFCIFVQWCALVWYLASYIPYGQRMIKGCFKSITNF